MNKMNQIIFHRPNRELLLEFVWLYWLNHLKKKSPPFSTSLTKEKKNVTGTKLHISFETFPGSIDFKLWIFFSFVPGEDGCNIEKGNDHEKTGGKVTENIETACYEEADILDEIRLAVIHSAEKEFPTRSPALETHEFQRKSGKSFEILQCLHITPAFRTK